MPEAPKNNLRKGSQVPQRGVLFGPAYHLSIRRSSSLSTEDDMDDIDSDLQCQLLECALCFISRKGHDRETETGSYCWVTRTTLLPRYVRKEEVARGKQEHESDPWLLIRREAALVYEGRKLKRLSLCQPSTGPCARRRKRRTEVRGTREERSKGRKGMGHTAWRTEATHTGGGEERRGRGRQVCTHTPPGLPRCFPLPCARLKETECPTSSFHTRGGQSHSRFVICHSRFPWYVLKGPLLALSCHSL